MLPDFVEPLGHGIFAIDTGFHRPRFDAAYLIVDGGRAAFVDTGTNLAVPRLLQALAAAGRLPADVDYVVPTHVHLDHAGGAGALMQALPAARLVVHPRGAPHLIDPTRLYEGALAIYGQTEMDRSYGRLIPIDARRVVSSHDGMTLAFGDRSLTLIDTPGHARHHHCVWDARSRGWFTGDTFGLSYREFDTARGRCILPTTTPVQFDPPALCVSIERLLEYQPECMYLTHFGRIAEVRQLGASLLEQIDEMTTLGAACRQVPDRRNALRAGLTRLSRRRLADHGVEDLDGAIKLLELDLGLNAQGLDIWLARAKV